MKVDLSRTLNHCWICVGLIPLTRVFISYSLFFQREKQELSLLAVMVGIWFVSSLEAALYPEGLLRVDSIMSCSLASVMTWLFVIASALGLASMSQKAERKSLQSRG